MAKSCLFCLSISWEIYLNVHLSQVSNVLTHTHTQKGLHLHMNVTLMDGIWRSTVLRKLSQWAVSWFRDVAQWLSACLAWAKPRIQFPRPTNRTALSKQVSVLQIIRHFPTSGHMKYFFFTHKFMGHCCDLDTQRPHRSTCLIFGPQLEALFGRL